MKFIILLLGLVTTCSSCRAQGSTIDELTRKQIIQIVRNALREDPTILRDALTALSESDEAHRLQVTQSMLADRRDEIFSNPEDSSAGNKESPLTVVEFYDPRCPYCRNMISVIDKLVGDIPVRVVFKDLAVLGPSSMLDAKLILAAKQGKYFQMRDGIMGHGATMSDGNLKQLASSYGIDYDKLEKDMSDPGIVIQLARNAALLKDLKIEGTPAFIVGNRVLTGIQTIEDLEKAVLAARPS